MKYLLWLVAVPLLVSFSRGSELMITEVFFDGTDERIELTNLDVERYQGTIVVEGVKSSSLSIDVDISPGQSLIVGDKGEHITNTGLYSILEKGLSISDTKAISVVVKNAETVLDLFLVNTGFVDDANNNKSSFELVLDTQSIQETSIDRSKNVLSSHKANPGVVLLSDGSIRSLDVGSGSNGSGDSQSGGVDTGTGSSGTTGSVGSGDAGTGSMGTGSGVYTGDVGSGDVTNTGLQSELHYDLMITEVFVDGTAERIEITNIGTGMFSGGFTILGAKSSNLSIGSVFIPPGKSMILSDKTDVFTDQSIVLESELGLNLLDTKEVYISLMVAEHVVDFIGLKEEDVRHFDNQKRSFEKVLYSGERITTHATIERRDGIIDPYIANPGSVKIVFELPEVLVFENIVRTCPAETSLISVSEISYFDNGLAPYIELKKSGFLSGKIILSGSMIADPIQLSRPESTTNEFLIISATMSGFLQETAVLTADIQWLSGGQIVIYGQSGQVLDNTYVDSLERSVSYYPSGPRQNCIMYFQAAEQPTPGMSSDVLSYFSFSESSDPGTSFGGCAPRPEFIDISIRGIIADPDSGDESIILHMNRGPDLKQLDGYYLMIGSRKRYLQGSLRYHQTDNIYQNFGFPNDRGECITLHNPEGEILDDICYTKDQASGLFLDMSSLSDEDEGNTEVADLDPDITIVDVIYDPIGLDTSNEVIHLQNNNALRYEQKDLWLQVGERNSKTYIYDSLWSNEEKEIRGNFRLPNNKPLCISLMHKQNLIDTYCYDPDTDSETTKSNSNSRAGSSNAIKDIEIKISSVVYDPAGSDTNNESISFELTKGKKVDISDFYLLAGKNKKTLAGILTDEEPLTITKTFGFHNSRITCITLMHGEKVFDQYCYDPNGRKESDSDKVLDSELTIEHIEYDPPGKDSDGEYITISNHSDQDVDMKNLLLNIGNRKESIDGLLLAQSQQSFEKYFRFPNAGACVSLMQGDTIYNTLCYGDHIDQEKGSDTSGMIKIVSIDYDPPGKDTNSESISLIRSGAENLNLENAYILINKRKKTLKGSLYPGILTTFTDNYRFPNSQACVSIYIDNQKHDTYCYGKDHGLGKFVSIEKVLPNPHGKDDNNEKIQIKVNSGLDWGFLSMKINDEPKISSRYLVGQQSYEASGTFGLTNKIGCVSISYQEIEQDRWCYHSKKEGKRATKEADQLSLASSEQARILNQITLADEKGSYCISRKGEKLSCKAKTTTRTVSSLDSFYRSYISSVHNYLYHNRPTLYFESDIALYRDRYKQADSQLRDGKKTLKIDGAEYATTNFGSIAQSQQATSYYDRMIKKLKEIQASNQI